MVPYFSLYQSSQAGNRYEDWWIFLLKSYYTEVTVTLFMCIDNVCLLRHMFVWCTIILNILSHLKTNEQREGWSRQTPIHELDYSFNCKFINCPFPIFYIRLISVTLSHTFLRFRDWIRISTYKHIQWCEMMWEGMCNTKFHYCV